MRRYAKAAWSRMPTHPRRAPVYRA
jgi:hypothetical protein